MGIESPGDKSISLLDGQLSLVKEKFDCYAWILVSQSHQKDKLLEKVVKKFLQQNKQPIPEGTEAMDVETLTDKRLLEAKEICYITDVYRLLFYKFKKIKN